MNIRLLLLLLCLVPKVDAQTLYTKAFGNPQHPALLFLHGGPGYNCASFEISTAPLLAEQGYYVIVYDRRGEGRSTDPNAEFSLAEAAADMQNVLEQYKVTKAHLLGHSFGGILALKFARTHPEMVSSVVLISAPLDLQESFQHIIAQCKTIYEAKEDLVNLKYLGLLQEMDPHSMLFASYCFMHALRNGFYTTPNPTPQAQQRYTALVDHPDYKRWGNAMTEQAPLGFHRNDAYTQMKMYDLIRQVLQKKVPVFGLYGEDDRLYPKTQRQTLEALLPQGHFKSWERCGHAVFIDQQALFFDAMNLLPKG